MEIGALIPTRQAPEAAATGTDEATLRETAKEFETVFVKEMLTHSGLADAFGADDGVATDTFSSYVLEDIARQLVDQGGFGLAERFYETLKHGGDNQKAVRL